MSTKRAMTELTEVAARIREMREVMGMSVSELAKL